MEKESGLHKIEFKDKRIERLANLYDHPEDFIPPDRKERLLANTLQTLSGLMAERIMKRSNLEIPYGFLENYKDAIYDGYVPILVTNHTSHADAAVSSKFINLLINEANTVLPDDEKMTFFTVPVAASLEMGQQGPLLRQFYLGAKPVIKRYGFYPNLIVRMKDHKPKKDGGYGMKLNRYSYARRYKEILDGTRNGTLIYPEGTTEGGKIGENGLPIGMVHFEEISIPFHLRLAKVYTGRTPMLITAGITGSHNAIDANTKSAAWTRLMSSYIDPEQFSMRVGEIIKTDSSEFEDLGTNGELNDFVGKKVASQLPEEMRGVYKIT